MDKTEKEDQAGLPHGLVRPVDPKSKSHWCKDCGFIYGEANRVGDLHFCADCGKPIAGTDGLEDWHKT